MVIRSEKEGFHVTVVETNPPCTKAIFLSKRERWSSGIHSVKVAEPRSLAGRVRAWDGRHLSNCYHLIKDFGYQGVLIEVEKERFSELEKNMAI